MSYATELREFRETYTDPIARDYWDVAVDNYLDISGPPSDKEQFLLAIAFAAAETSVRVEIDTHVRKTLNMIPDYIEPNTDGTWTVMLYETQTEVKVGYGIVPAWPKPESMRPVRDLINDPDYTV